VEFFPHDANFDFIGRSRLFIGFSIVTSIASIVAVFVLGLNLGIDFAGGYEMEARFQKATSEHEIVEALSPLQLGEPRVQRYGAEGENSYLILIREHSALTDEQKVALKGEVEQLAGGADKLTTWSIAESGESLRAGFSAPVADSALRELLEKRGLHVKEIGNSGREDAPQYNVLLVSIGDKVENALRQKLGIDPSVDVVSRVEFVGPQVGEQLRNQGILAVVYSLFFILLYIAIRFDFYFAPGAIIATLHDVIITMGVFAVGRLQFDLPAIASVLTLVGYSLNDTVVVYDRIRENSARQRGRDIKSIVNSAINQTLSRTILTSGLTGVVCVALVIWGGPTIRDFSIALLAGIIVGTYSSIAIASPVYIWLRDRFGKNAAKAGEVVAA
jgi:preprotein translocase subunit SecF